MPTQNKTANLGLNSWLGTDKPLRTDFVEDNTIIDTVISEHLNDVNLHLSEETKTLLENPFTIGVISGNGESSKIHTLPFAPRCIFVFLRNSPFIEYSVANGYTLCNSALIAANGGGGTYGASLSSNNLTLKQSTVANNNRFLNLNKNGAQYVYIAFK